MIITRVEGRCLTNIANQGPVVFAFRLMYFSRWNFSRHLIGAGERYTSLTASILTKRLRKDVEF